MPLNEDEKAELVAYLDGELDDVTTQAVEAKIATNPDVRAELDALKQAWGLLDFLPKAEPSPNFTHRTLERLTLEKVGGATTTAPMPGKTSWFSGAVWAAVVLVALGGGYFAAMRIWPSPTPEPISEDELPLVRHLRIAEKWRLYEYADDLDFVRKLNHHDLFGDDPS